MTVAPYTCILDPAAVSPGRTELNLNAGAIAIPSPAQISWGEAAIKAFLAEQLYGEAPADFRIPNRQVEIPLVLGAKQNGTEAEEELARQKLQEKVGLLQRQGGVVLRQRPNGEPLYSDIVNASLVVPDVYGEAGGVEPGVILHLECLPDFYGEEITLDAVEGTGNIAAVLQKGGAQAVILGDYPARTRIVLTEKAKQNQRSMLWGFRSTSYSAVAEAALFFDAYLLTLINGTTAEVDASTYSGHSALLSAPEVNIWHPFLETAIAATGKNLTHLGSFRVWARCSGTPGDQVRLAWSANDATAPTLNVAAVISTAGWDLFDLGEIRIEESPVGEHWWKGILQVNTGAVSTPIAADRIWLQPLDDGAGKLRATAIPMSTLLAPVHPATAGANATGGIAGTIAWTNVAGATKVGESAKAEIPFTGAGATQLLKLTGFGFAIPSGAEIKGIEVEPNMLVVGQPERFARAALILFKAGAQAGSLHSQTAEGAFTLTSKGGSTDLWGTTWTPAQINASNFGVGLMAESTTAAETILKVSCPVTVRVYYSIGASSVTQDAVLFSERKTEVRTEGSFREDVTTTAYANVSEETGDLPRLPPSGLEGRAVQLFVKNSRALIANAATNEAGEQDTGIDKIQAQIIYRPSYLGRI